ncbi:TIGR02186 family protein [Acidithiobacillus sp. AMEEHan]|uniref:TIGR02186 family protein n=1 Tax=Acidithiobacillus sp. AMEEHan TaxID=2994951 RepID=UPI0027E466C6|nr:TIGR02186 family protein [Acidithiobacillus sp. AMEEHan]
MQKKLLLVCSLAGALLFPAMAPVAAQASLHTPNVVLGTGTDKVDVTSRFRGRDILVFGALSHPGAVIAVLRSPDSAVAVTRKTQMGPIWVTGKKVTVSQFPGVLLIDSSAPLDKILPAAERKALGLDPYGILEKAKYEPEPQDRDAWMAAVIAAKERQGTYQIRSGSVAIQDGRLFSTHLHLPASLPLGSYELDVYLVNHGKILAQSQQKIDVQQVGLEEWIADYAEHQPWLYGVALTLILAFLGLGLGIVMQRKS